MVHEAMILEYSGRYLALIEWSAQIKFVLYGALLINLFFPWGITTSFTLFNILLAVLIFCTKLALLCVALTVAETHLAKLRLFRAPYLLNFAFLFGLLGVLSHIILELPK